MSSSQNSVGSPAVMSLVVVVGAVVAVLSAWLVHYLVFKLKLFSKVLVRQIVVPKGQVICTSYQGLCRNMMPFVETVKRDFKSYGDKIKFCGLYYDNPDVLVDKANFRGEIGIILGESDDFDAERFVKASHKSGFTYKTRRFEQLNSFGAKFPFFNGLALLVAIIKGYPALMKYGKEHKLIEQTGFSLEIYDHSSQQLTICFPYGEEAQALWYLSDFPQPEYKKCEVK